MKWQLVAAVAFAFPLVGQTPGTTGSPAPAPAGQEPAPTEQKRVDQRAQSMRTQIEHGKQIQLHVRVAVRLKNGNRLIGVVKDGRMVERVDGLRFVEAQARDRGAGIRLWYTGGKRNFVFVPFTDLAEYEVLARLSNKQIAAIESEMQLAERSTAVRGEVGAAPLIEGVEVASPAPSGEAAPVDAPQQPLPVPAPLPVPLPGQTGAAGAAPAGQTPTPATAAPGSKPATAKTMKGEKGEPGADDPAAAKAKGETEQQRQWFGLLQEYPPADGWNKAKRDEIARRKIVVGATPSAREQRFVEMYEHWLKACQHFAVGPGASTEEPDVDASKEEQRRRKKK